MDPIDVDGFDHIENVGPGAGGDEPGALCTPRFNQARRENVPLAMKTRERIHSILGRSAESYPIGNGCQLGSNGVVTVISV